MKKLLYNATFILLVLILATSCSRNDDNSPTPSSSNSVSTTLPQGEWKITYFNDSGTDETSHFTGYSFQFNSNGNVVATKGSNNVNGTWSDGNDNSTPKLVLNFGATVPFDDLNEDWHITQQNSTMIKLEHVSGGNGGTDTLYFEKI